LIEETMLSVKNLLFLVAAESELFA
jgi:hypothetical protein